MDTRLISVAAVILAAITMPALSFAADQKQTYAVSGCSVSGQYIGLAGWTASSVAARAAVAVDECAAGGRMGFVLDATPGAAGRWSFTAPPGTVVDALAFYGIVGVADSNPQLVVSVDGQAATRLLWFTGVPFPIPGPIGVETFQGRSVVLEFSCPTACAGPASLNVSRLDTVLRDVEAPVVGFDAPRRSLRFSDVGGGVESVDLEIDGEARSFPVGGEACRRPFTATIPCALSGEVALADLGLGPGEHSVFATLVDAAGNRTYSGPHLFRIDPPPAPATQPQPPRGVVIVAGEKRRRITYATTKVGGIVRDLEGFPLAGAKVAVMTCAATGVCRTLPGVRTDKNGKLVVTIPRGPSREIRLRYGDSEQTVKLIVAAPIRLSSDRKVTRNGRTITFRGRIPEAGAARARVTLQAWARGKWMPFRTVALKGGRFSARYRFNRTFATTRYRFRAVVASAPDLPFAAGASGVLSILVRSGK